MTTPTSDVDTCEAERLAAGGALLLDVREPEEWASGHAPGATHVPLGRLDPATLPIDQPIDRSSPSVARATVRARPRGRCAL